MSSSLTLIEPPETDPVTVAEVRARLRVPGTSENAAIADMIADARAQAEHITCRALITQTWERTLCAFPACGGRIHLGMPPVVEIETVKYIDVDGVEQTMAEADYQLDLVNMPGWLHTVDGADWPQTSTAVPIAVRVRFVCGYGDAAEDVPAPIREWIHLQVGAAYRNREAFLAGTGSATAELPNRFVDRKLDRYRVWSV